MKKFLILSVLAMALLAPLASSAEEEKWEGVDVAVIEKTAEESGRKAVSTPFNSIEGDMLLFAFLLGGVAGGFAGGYYYRALTEKGTEESKGS